MRKRKLNRPDSAGNYCVFANRLYIGVFEVEHTSSGLQCKELKCGGSSRHVGYKDWNCYKLTWHKAKI